MGKATAEMASTTKITKAKMMMQTWGRASKSKFPRLPLLYRMLTSCSDKDFLMSLQPPNFSDLGRTGLTVLQELLLRNRHLGSAIDQIA